MPWSLVSPLIRKATPGFEGIKLLSESCESSLVAAAIRYCEVTEECVAVIVSHQGAVEFMTASSSFKQLPGLDWLRKREQVLAEVPTHRLGTNLDWVRTCSVSQEGALLNQWFPNAPKQEIEEDVVGLGSYERTLTVLIADAGPEEEEEKEEPDDGHGHGHGVDPHWWHSIDLFRRATGIVAAALEAKSPENAALFHKNAATYRTKLDELEKWARREIARIPRDRRHLATTHAAFNYLCRDFGFVPHPVQGLNREQMPEPRELAKLVADLRANHVAAIFPETESNPKILNTLTNDTGIKLGKPLIADGTGGLSYLEMVRHNVEAIVKGLE
jgi:hypothetical protein